MWWSKRSRTVITAELCGTGAQGTTSGRNHGTRDPPRDERGSLTKMWHGGSVNTVSRSPPMPK
jgi:hypothetical protein